VRILVTYDIATGDEAGEKRLRRVARAMEGFGIRVQKSVFECDLDPAQLVRLEIVAEELIDPQCDSVIVYRLQAERTLRLGVSGPDPFTPRAFVR
jgi:CRISPR-associated protein Cas2